MKKVEETLQKVRAFRERIANLSRFKKAVLLILVVAVPAGIALASFLIVAWNRSRD